MEYIINIEWDEESQTWMGYNDEIPLAFDADTIEELLTKIRQAAPEIIEMNHLPKATTLYFLAQTSWDKLENITHQFHSTEENKPIIKAIM